ncbi:transferase spermidine synthase [Undibacterium sp.]|uniref:spermine/spermidine synthase domain-containing protein n=1 Tax=Undibacterium sp. TaxID=1914977 RepID=UPI0025D9AEF0|nr:transferase spermidine synthase [Undibacterium sp.]
MQKISHSLPSLFFDPARQTELVRMMRLEALQAKHKGRPFVFDEGNLRYMYFNLKSVQSAMKINAPDELICGYTRGMMAFLMANPAPQHILMIGLGGGSLVKFCYRHLPDCRITVLEIDADVIALREQFMVPADDARLQIIHADAIEYLANINASIDATLTQFDVILLDGFSIEGLVQELNSTSFYASCYAALSAQGCLVVNMWGKRKLLIPALSALRTQFEQNVWWCRSLDSYNLLVFCFKNGPTGFTSEMAAKAQQLDQVFPLQLEKLNAGMHTLRIQIEAQDQSDVWITEEYEAREMIALSRDLAAIMVTDASLPRNDVEWSLTHQ